MERVCEFCKSLRPIVYCKSDAAHLCLSCDAKVHSANALSYRHPRTIVCESCRNRGAHVRCFDHLMFLCRSCDAGLHHASSQHKKRAISTYMGCPSAKDLTLLWGFELNELENKQDDQSVYFPSVSSASGAVSSNIPRASTDEGSSSRGKKVLNDENRKENTCSILQQIVELERKLAEGIDVSRSVRAKEGLDGSSLFEYDPNWKVHKSLGEEQSCEFEYMASPGQKATEESFSSPFSQLDDQPLHEEPLWESNNNEIWLQNMQDLGVCDQMQYYEEINIPELDLTFRNFEELFGHEQGSSAAQVDHKHSTGKIDSARASTSATNDMSRHFPTEVPAEFYLTDKVHPLQETDFAPRPRPPKLSYSTSFSASRITGESTDSECKDDEVSPSFSKSLHPYGSFDSSMWFDGKDHVMKRCKEKKISRHARQGQYAFQKTSSDGKKVGRRSIFEGRMP